MPNPSRPLRIDFEPSTGRPGGGSPCSTAVLHPHLLVLALGVALLSGCSTTPPVASPRSATQTTPQAPARDYFALDDPTQSQELVMFAFGLLDTGYRFGGRNPEAGLDCSGMVSYIYNQAAGIKVQGSAADIARRGRPIERHLLRPGDLVFFNTQKRRHSHMGIYLGDGRFIHAPSSRGAVRVERLDNTYFAPRIDGMRTLLARNW